MVTAVMNLLNGMLHLKCVNLNFVRSVCGLPCLCLCVSVSVCVCVCVCVCMYNVSATAFLINDL